MLSLISQSPTGAARRAQEDFNAGNYSLAERDLSRALKAEPQNWTLWFYLGITRARLKEMQPAVEALERARLLAPREAPIYFNLGLLYLEKSDVQKALQVYREGLALEPTDAATNQNYALLLMQQRMFREAIEPLRRLKTVGVNNVSTRAAPVEAYLKCGMETEAKDEAEELLKRPGATLQKDLEFASILIADRETNAAEQTLKQVEALWPDSAEAHGELGLLFIRSEHEELRKRSGEFF
jgi:tetratricopeptide (TPR) repeat protein